MKVLIINHAEDITLLDLLRTEEISYECAGTITKASEQTDLYEYDCILLNITGNESEAFEWLETFTGEHKKDGIIVLSAIDNVKIRIRAFDIGVDDFMLIPFHASELVARLKAVVRRKKFNTRTKLHFGNLVVDLLAYEVRVWDVALKLTKKEYDILLHLIANKDRIISKTALAEYVWGDAVDNMASYNLLFAHIKNLRKKLITSKSGVDIRNSYGVGYQIIEI